MKRTFLKGLALAMALATVTAMSACTTQGPGSVTESSKASSETIEGASGAASEASGKKPSATPETANKAAESNQYPALKVKSDGKLKVGLVYHNLETESQARNYQQTKIETAHRGWELAEAYFNSTDEARTGMQSLITQDVDAIIIGNTDMPALADLVVQARQKGIGVYNVDNQIVPGVVSNAGQPNGVAGAELAYKLGQDFMWDASYAVITNPAIQVQMERTEVAKAIFGQYAGMIFVGEETINSQGASESPTQQAFNYAKRFFEKHGKDLDIIFCSYDRIASACDEAAKQVAGGTEVAIIGIDGGSQAWSYIREKGSNFMYSYAQPTELYNHSTFELINQLQAEGKQPGDEGCMLDYFGQTMYFTGYIVDKNNVPDSGDPIHAAFNYYGGDPDDANAWYNWQEAGGPTMIQ